jgi:hypothetical protein
MVSVVSTDGRSYSENRDGIQRDIHCLGTDSVTSFKPTGFENLFILAEYRVSHCMLCNSPFPVFKILFSGFIFTPP